ncbi:hypothetical protein GP486_001208 [Trichoglossum hirsutum]|uniref:RNA ligase/cyclic nucleotide phosphodiesterase n=1 Tax=Trichoglossum hirsutum TaxID=265104 RepID=A0A9P8LH98_9PEZI|nr:hypothetical protein GP486_001208 [Trichoglossum hirsutum]
MDEKLLPTMLDTIIATAGDDASLIQEYCETQRTNRNEKLKQKMLDQNFEGVRTETILVNLLSIPGYLDPRNNICVWARPTESIKEIVAEIQHELRVSAPGIWLMPLPCLHMTVLEVLHSKTPEVMDSVLQKLQPCISQLANYTFSHRVRLVRPKLSFDDLAVALTFVPAASGPDDSYTYLHLRRDLSRICHQYGVEVKARYATTSCHFTVARFVSVRDHVSEGVGGVVVPSHEKIKSWVSKLEYLNDRLRERYWPENSGGEWYVGQELGLDIRKGRMWYGGGESIENRPSQPASSPLSFHEQTRAVRALSSLAVPFPRASSACGRHGPVTTL